MNKKINKNLIFIAENSNSHTARWESYFRSRFTNYTFLNLHVNSVEEINSIILKNYGPRQSIVFSGPIHNISLKLRVEAYSHFLLSYGYDLQLHLDSIKHLLIAVNSRKDGGIIIDNNFNFDILSRIGVQNEKIFKIPWGLESVWFENKTKDKNFSLNRPQTFISARSHETIYNVDSSIKLFNEYLIQGGQGTLLILGSGSLTEELKETVLRFNIENKVKFIGQVSEMRYKDLLSTADFYLSSSLIDGSSVSLLQAMAMGVIPIVSDIQTNKEWVSHNISGFLFNIERKDTFFKYNQKYFYEKNLDRISSNARRSIISKCNWDKNLKFLTNFIVQNTQIF